MKFSVNYKDVVEQIIPSFFRNNNFLMFLYSIIKALKSLNNKYYGTNKIDDYGSYQYWKYYLGFTGQTNSLEKFLNEIYDFLNRIYIENTKGGRIYLYNLIESLQPIYIYNLYDNTVTYAINERSCKDSKVYKSLQNGNLNKPVGSEPTWWVEDGSVPFLFQNGEVSTQYDFIVWIPDAIKLSCGYPNYKRMTSQINFFKIAPKNFIILTF